MSSFDPAVILASPIAEQLQDGLPRRATSGLTFVSAAGEPDDVVPYAQLALDARRFAAGYIAAGVQPGDRVALMIPDSRSFVTAFFAALHTGAVPVPIYPPMRIDSLGEYLEQTRHIVGSAAPRLIVTDGQVRRVLGTLVTPERPLVTVDKLWKVRDEAPLVPCAMEDLAFLQYTSGSTSYPKGVQLTHTNLAANMHAIASALVLEPETDVAVSWLPLYHDMGLIGCVMTCTAAALPLVIIPPLNFLKRPSSWVRRMSDHKASLSFAPNFGYGLTTHRTRERAMEGLDLSRWRVAGCGAEPIHRPTLQAFCDKFAPAGFNPGAMLPSYGLAESTLAVSFVDLGSGAQSIHVSRTTLVDAGKAQLLDPDDPDAVELVPCGTPFEGHAIDIRGPEGSLEEGTVGEIVVQGPSVTKGYFQAPETDADLFDDGWLRTGDLGFRLNGELVICGRKKDLIIVHGRNLYASDIERVIGQNPSVRKGQVAAFGIQQEDGERVVICIEPRADTDTDALKSSVSEAALEHFGLKGTEVVLLPKGSLPKTSSGKIRRHRARARYLEGALNGARDNRLTTAGHLASSQIGLLRNEIKGFLGRLRPSQPSTRKR